MHDSTFYLKVNLSEEPLASPTTIEQDDEIPDVAEFEPDEPNAESDQDEILLKTSESGWTTRTAVPQAAARLGSEHPDLIDPSISRENPALAAQAALVEMQFQAIQQQQPASVDQDDSSDHDGEPVFRASVHQNSREDLKSSQKEQSVFTFEATSTSPSLAAMLGLNDAKVTEIAERFSYTLQPDVDVWRFKLGLSDAEIDLKRKQEMSVRLRHVWMKMREEQSMAARKALEKVQAVERKRLSRRNGRRRGGSTERSIGEL